MLKIIQAANIIGDTCTFVGRRISDYIIENQSIVIFLAFINFAYFNVRDHDNHCGFILLNIFTQVIDSNNKNA